MEKENEQVLQQVSGTGGASEGQDQQQNEDGGIPKDVRFVQSFNDEGVEDDEEEEDNPVYSLVELTKKMKQQEDSEIRPSLKTKDVRHRSVQFSKNLHSYDSHSFMESESGTGDGGGSNKLVGSSTRSQQSTGSTAGDGAGTGISSTRHNSHVRSSMSRGKSSFNMVHVTENFKKEMVRDGTVPVQFFCCLPNQSSGRR